MRIPVVDTVREWFGRCEDDLELIEEIEDEAPEDSDRPPLAEQDAAGPDGYPA